MTSFCWSVAGLGVGIAFTLDVARALGTLGTVFFATSILLPFAAAASIATRRTRSSNTFLSSVGAIRASSNL